MRLVLDASVTIAWLHDEERTPAVEAIFAEAPNTTYAVPRLWHLEVANILMLNHRRGRYSLPFVSEQLADLALLEIQLDDRTELCAWQQTLQLALSHRLTIYDASYLELAIRLQVPLATLDGDLRRAASAEGVPLLGM